jgi:hypothetical protein
MKQEITQEPLPAVKKIVPGKAWKPLKDMFKELGEKWSGV